MKKARKIPDPNFSKKPFYLPAFILLTLLFTGCGSIPTVAPQDAATVTGITTNPSVSASPSASPTVPPTSKAAITSSVIPSATPKPTKTCPQIAVDYLQYSLAERINQAEQIFLGEIIEVDDFIWNTPDGKAPSDPCATKYGQPLPKYEQLAPVKVLIRESFKGNLQPSTTIPLLIFDAPGALPGNTTHRLSIPLKKGESIIWFLGKEVNYRSENPQNPLNYPALLEGFSKNLAGMWVGGIASPGLTDINQLKELIKTPPLTPTLRK